MVNSINEIQVTTITINDRTVLILDKTTMRISHENPEQSSGVGNVLVGHVTYKLSTEAGDLEIGATRGL